MDDSCSHVPSRAHGHTSCCCFSFFLCHCSCGGTFVHGSSEQAMGKVCLSVNPPVDAFARFTILLNDDANSFARYEPNTTDGPEDHGGDFDLAGVAWRAARTGSVYGGNNQGAVSTQCSPPWSGLGMNLLGPTLRFETQTDPTGPSTVARRRSG